MGQEIDHAEVERQRGISDASADNQLTTHDIPQLLRNIHAEVHVTADKLEVDSIDKLLQVSTRTASLFAKTAQDSHEMQTQVKNLTAAIADHNRELVALNRKVGPLTTYSFIVAVFAAVFALGSLWLQWWIWKHPEPVPVQVTPQSPVVLLPANGSKTAQEALTPAPVPPDKGPAAAPAPARSTSKEPTSPPESQPPPPALPPQPGAKP